MWREMKVRSFNPGQAIESPSGLQMALMEASSHFKSLSGKGKLSNMNRVNVILIRVEMDQIQHFLPD